MADKQIVFEVVVKGNKEVFTLQQQIKQLKKDLAKTDDPTIADQLLRDLTRLQIELKKAQANAKQAQKEFEAKDETIGSYKRLSAELTVARNRFKDLAASGKASQKELDAARNAAARLDAQLKKIDAQVGESGRNVGNYAGSLKGLFAQVRQTIGRGSILQSIPQFINLGVRAYEKITEAIDFYNESFNESFLITKRVEEATGDLIGEYVKERSQLDGLTKIAADENATKEQRAQAVDALQAQYPDYFSSLDRENISIADLKTGYEQANEQLIKNIKTKIRAQIIEKQFADAAQKAIDAEKARQESLAATAAIAESSFDVSFGLLDKLFEAGSEASKQRAETAANAAKDVESVDRALESVFSTVVNVLDDTSAAFDNSEENLKKLADGTTKAADAAAKKQKEISDKAAAQRKKDEEQRQKELEQLAKDSAKFAEEQAKSRLDLQKQIQQAVIDNIKDEGAKAIAQEVFNFEQRKAQQRAQFDELVKRIEEQEQRLIDVLGVNSEEVIEFRRKANEELANLENQFNQLSEQDELAHQNALAEIEKQGNEKRTQDAQKALDERLKAEAEARAKIERQTELSILRIEELLANGKITVQEASRQIFEAEQSSLQQRLALIAEQLKTETQLSQEQKDELLLQQQRLNTELAKLQEDQTEKVEAESKKRSDALFKGISQGLSFASQAIERISEFTEAASKAEQERLQRGLEERQNNISALEEELSQASGLEAEFLQQRIEEEKFAAQAIADEQIKTQKAAAKQAKALAIIQAIINTALGITQALASLPPPASFITAAITGVLGGVEIATIAAQPLATGGVVGKNINGKPVRRANGDNVLTTLKTGEVVLNESQQALLGGGRTFAAIGVPGFATGGVVATPPSIPATLGANQQFEEFKTLIKQTQELAIATNNRIDKLEVVYTPNTEAARVNDQRDRLEIQNKSRL